MPFSTKQKFAEFFRVSFDESDDGLWIASLDRPLPINLPLEEQEHHLYKFFYFLECNKPLATMYGYADPSELVGVRLPQLLLLNDPANISEVRKFLSSGYRIKNMKTHELSKNREEKYFLKDVMGVIEHQHLVRIWGRQKDITAHRLKSGEQLTSQQVQILRLTVEGKTLKEISHFLGITEKSVDTIRSRLRRKLGARSTPHLAVRAFQLGLFDLTEML
jgi:DNA-binding CsgD family transcriptional regulator